MHKATGGAMKDGESVRIDPAPSPRRRRWRGAELFIAVCERTGTARKFRSVVGGGVSGEKESSYSIDG